MNLSDEQLGVFKTMYLPDASDRELAWVRQVCKSKGLDPFAGDVVFNRRGGKLVDVTTIDGARKRAARTGEYGGTDMAEFADTDDGDKVCRITVYRLVQGNRVPFPAQRFFKETKGSGPVWQKSPRLMFEKCTEMTALRKAFPDALGGAYEEGEPFHEEAALTEIPETPSIDMRWQNAVQAFAVFNIDEAQMLARIEKKTLADVTDEDIEALHAWYQECEKS